MAQQEVGRVGAVLQWLRGSVDGRDVLAFAGIALVAWGLGFDESSGRIAAGAGLFYIGVFHPLVVRVAASQTRRD